MERRKGHNSKWWQPHHRKAEKCSWIEKDVLHSFSNWTWYLFPSLFINLFIYSFIHSFNNLFIWLFNCLSIYFLMYLFSHSFIHSFTHVFICLFVYLFIYNVFSVDSPVAEVFKNVIISKWTKCWLGEKKIESFSTFISDIAVQMTCIHTTLLVLNDNQ